MLPSRPIVVVDDDPEVRALVLRALEPLHIPCVELGSNADLLSRLEGLNPALLVLDLLRPGADGLHLVEQVRENPNCHQLPIIVLTGPDPEFVERAFECGAGDYVAKPFRGPELLARARRQLQVQRELLQLEQRRAELQTVVNITQAIATAQDTRQVMFDTVRTLAQLTGADRVSIVTVSDAGAAAVIASSDDAELNHIPIDVRLYPELRYALMHRRPVVVSDATNAPFFPSDERSQLPYASFAVIPIEDNERCLGVLFLRSKTPKRFKLERTPLLQTVGQTLGSALRQAERLQLLRAESRQSAEALARAESTMRSFQPYADFFRNSADGMIVMEPNGRILFANPRARVMAGGEAPLEGTSAFDYLIEEERANAKTLGQGFRQGVYPTSVDFRVRSPSGSRTLSVSFSQTPSSVQQGVADSAILLTFRDVTRERRTERSLRHTTEFLERLIDSSVDAIVSADMKGRVLVFNRAAARIFGYAQTDVVGKMNVVKLYPPGGASDVMRKIRSSRYGGPDRLEDHQVNMQDSAGRLIPVKISAALISDNGVAIGSVGVFTDIRDKLRMRAHLLQAQEELRAHEKSVAVAQLAGTMAHELNQPLTVILSYADLLARKLKEDDALNRTARVIAEQAQRMANIVRQIGRITKYETKAYVGNAHIIDLDRSSAGEQLEEGVESEP